MARVLVSSDEVPPSSIDQRLPLKVTLPSELNQHDVCVVYRPTAVPDVSDRGNYYVDLFKRQAEPHDARYMAVRFRDGGLRIVYPKSDDALEPTPVIVVRRSTIPPDDHQGTRSTADTDGS